MRGLALLLMLAGIGASASAIPWKQAIGRKNPAVLERGRPQSQPHPGDLGADLGTVSNLRHTSFPGIWISDYFSVQPRVTKNQHCWKSTAT
jgi:hypothetical protein